jgi:aryl-phospho-beta-D-glucosidase BglC (GH1 family)
MTFVSLKRVRVRTLLCFVFLIFFLANMAWTPFTKSIVYASSADTLQMSTNDSDPLSTDVIGDGVVNICDLVKAALAFGSSPEHPKWDSRADVNDDGVVNERDLEQITADLGKGWLRYDFDEPLDWNVVSGTWSIQNGLLEGVGNAEGLIYTDDIVWSDCNLTAKVKIAADSPRAEAAFCVRLGDSGNSYWIGLGCWGHRVSISKIVDHVAEELIFSGDRADVVKDVWYIVSIKVSGNAIMFYVNDVLELVAYDSTFMKGMIGIRPWNSHVLVDFITISGCASSLKPKKTSLLLKGVSWYGIDSYPLSYKMTEEYFDFLAKNFPDMNLLALMVSAYSIMPRIGEGNYYTIDYAKLDLLRNFVSWCKPHGIGVLLVNDWNSLNEAHLKAYWKFMSQQFKDEDAIIGFDLINEPWAFAHGHSELIGIYERVIDAIREIDPARTCYVQTYLYHREGLGWVRTNPVKRDNVVYSFHIYSNWYKDTSNHKAGDWYDAYSSPWVKYYENGDYATGKQILRDALYERCGFVKQELGYELAITELAFTETDGGLQYGRDLLDVLNEWGVSWVYCSYYSPRYRPMCLLDNDGNFRSQAKILQKKMP